MDVGRIDEPLPFLSAASKRRVPGSQPGMADPHQFFDDTSSAPSRGYGGHPSPGGLGYPTSSSEAAFLAAPMSNMAMAYGSSLAAQGKELVDKNVSRLAWWAQAGSEWQAGPGP